MKLVFVSVGTNFRKARRDFRGGLEPPLGLGRVRRQQHEAVARGQRIPRQEAAEACELGREHLLLGFIPANLLAAVSRSVAADLRATPLFVLTGGLKLGITVLSQVSCWSQSTEHGGLFLKLEDPGGVFFPPSRFVDRGTAHVLRVRLFWNRSQSADHGGGIPVVVLLRPAGTRWERRHLAGSAAKGRLFVPQGLLFVPQGRGRGLSPAEQAGCLRSQPASLRAPLVTIAPGFSPFTAAWEEMNARGELGRTTDCWTRTLLLTLKARASLRAFAAATAVDPGSWSDRATRDLLDASAALEFFDPRLLAPFLQWLVAVLPRERARGLIDELLPVEGVFVSRVTEPRHRELGQVVQSVARALRRQYFFGRYDLRRAGRLRRLLGRLQYPRSGARALAWVGWLFVADRFVPRLLAGCVVGILPFLITDEAWRLATEVSILRISALSFVAAVLVLVYLFYDRHQADPAGLSPCSGVVSVWLTGRVESLALAAGVQWLAAPTFHEALGYCGRFNDGVFLASAAFALGVGVFTQLIWQEKAVTAPP